MFIGAAGRAGAEANAIRPFDVVDSSAGAAKTISDWIEPVVPGTPRSIAMAIEDDLDMEVVTDESLHWLIDGRIFKYIVTALIILNCVIMGLAAEYPGLPVWSAFEHLFTAAFLLEMIFKVAVLGRGYFADRWNLADCALVWLAIVDVWILALVDGEGQLQMLSALRAVRLFRLARILRLFKQFERLILVLVGVVEAMQTTFWVAGVLLIAIYVAAIFCVSYLGGEDDGTYPGYTLDMAETDATDLMVEYNPYLSFGNMSRAMLTLFNIAIMAEWTEIVRPLMVKQPGFVLFFILFVMFVTFGIMNVIIAMIVDNVMVNARKLEQERVNAEVDRKKRTLRQIQVAVKALDADGSGKIDLKELEAVLADRSNGLSNMLHSSTLRLPKGFSAQELLCMLDDNGDYSLDHEEFVQSFYRLIDSGQFQQICLIQTGINSLKRLVRDSVVKTLEQQGEAELACDRMTASHNAVVDQRLASIEASLRALSSGSTSPPAAPAVLEPAKGWPVLGEVCARRTLREEVDELQRNLRESFDKLSGAIQRLDAYATTTISPSTSNREAWPDVGGGCADQKALTGRPEESSSPAQQLTGS